MYWLLAWNFSDSFIKAAITVTIAFTTQKQANSLIIVIRFVHTYVH